MNRSLAFLVGALTIAVIGNLILLNYTVFKLLPARLNASETQRSSTQSTSYPQADSCGPACQSALSTALAQVDQKIATVASRTTVSASASPAPIVRATASPALTKESFIPLTGGHTMKSEWEDLAGSDVYINTANFPGIKETYFEVGMHIPTKNGTLYARLYNVTDKHPVWYSDVSTDQDVSTFRSAKFQLDSGNKQYRVQLKTTLQYDSILDTARIKIISQ